MAAMMNREGPNGTAIAIASDEKVAEIEAEIAVLESELPRWNRTLISG